MFSKQFGVSSPYFGQVVHARHSRQCCDMRFFFFFFFCTLIALSNIFGSTHGRFPTTFKRRFLRNGTRTRVEKLRVPVYYYFYLFPFRSVGPIMLFCFGPLTPPPPPFAHTHTHTHKHTRLRRRAHARTHTQTHTHARTHAQKNTHARTHARTSTHTHTHTRARAHTHSVWLGSTPYNVQAYAAPVRRCTKCQSLGHTKQQCRARQGRCSKCGGNSHIHDKCDAATKFCVNCNSRHSAAYKGCPEMLIRQRANTLRSREYLPYTVVMQRAREELKPRVRESDQPAAKPVDDCWS